MTILRGWAYVEADLQEQGIDLSDPAVWFGKSYRWLKARIEGLLSKPPQLLVVPEEDGVRVVRVPQSRIALALEPPDFSPRKPTTTQEEDHDGP